MRINKNPANATAGFLRLPKDTYTLEVASMKPVQYDQNPNAIRYGVNVSFIVVSDGQYKGKTVTFFAGQHDEMNEGITKRFQMAVLGFNPKKQEEEATFNEECGGKDWSFDTDKANPSLGDAWTDLKGKIVVCEMDEKADKSDASKVYQTWSFLPYLP